MNTDQLIADLRRDEGAINHAYQDSLGYWTIGVGHLVDARKGGKVSDGVINLMLSDDIADVVADLNDHLPWWKDLDEPRQRALANMVFNLGVTGLLKFHRFLTAMEDGDWATAGMEMMASKWATEVGDRAKRLQGVILGGAA